MSTVDANRVVLTGENSVIRLTDNDSDNFTTNATFWRILSSAGGPGHVLYLKSELTEVSLANLLGQHLDGALAAVYRAGGDQCRASRPVHRCDRRAVQQIR